MSQVERSQLCIRVAYRMYSFVDAIHTSHGHSEDDRESRRFHGHEQQARRPHPTPRTFQRFVIKPQRKPDALTGAPPVSFYRYRDRYVKWHNRVIRPSNCGTLPLRIFLSTHICSPSSSWLTVQQHSIQLHAHSFRSLQLDVHCHLRRSRWQRPTRTCARHGFQPLGCPSGSRSGFAT